MSPQQLAAVVIEELCPRTGLEGGDIDDVILACCVLGLDRSADARAPVTLLVTISGTDVGGLGAPFWGLVAGIAVTYLLDRRQ